MYSREVTHEILHIVEERGVATGDWKPPMQFTSTYVMGIGFVRNLLQVIYVVTLDTHRR